MKQDTPETHSVLQSIFCITVPGHDASLKSSYRCLESARMHHWNPNVQIFFGFSPAHDDIKTLFKNESLDAAKFIGSKESMSCFFSHYHLWKKIANEQDDSKLSMILEHDAIFHCDQSDLERMSQEIDSIRYCCNVGKPSFGKYKTRKIPGVHPLYSKPYFPGAHSYLLRPSGARLLIDHAKKNGPEPTDVFLSLKNFQWLQEISPWITHVEESFSTVQKVEGCIAKHQYQLL